MVKQADCRNASDDTLDRERRRRRHSPPMSRLNLAVLIGIIVMLAGVAVPPVIEDHLEAGFCSADCPAQHPGHGAATSPPAPPTAARGPAPTAPARPPAPDPDLLPL